MHSRLILLAASLLLISTQAAGATLKMNPGLWEVTTTTHHPMMQQPQTMTQQECIKDQSFEPRMMAGEQHGCVIDKESASGNTLTFSATCTMQGAESKLDGKFSTDGKTGTGVMNMRMSYQGQTMNMKTEWRGKRLGGC